MHQSIATAPAQLRIVRERQRFAREPLPERLACRIRVYCARGSMHPEQVARLLCVDAREVYRALIDAPVLASTRRAIEEKL